MDTVTTYVRLRLTAMIGVAALRLRSVRFLVLRLRPSATDLGNVAKRGRSCAAPASGSVHLTSCLKRSLPSILLHIRTPIACNEANASLFAG